MYCKPNYDQSAIVFFDLELDTVSSSLLTLLNRGVAERSEYTCKLLSELGLFREFVERVN